MCVCVSPRLLQARGLGGFCRLSGCGCGGVCVCVGGDDDDEQEKEREVGRGGGQEQKSSFMILISHDCLKVTHQLTRRQFLLCLTA